MSSCFARKDIAPTLLTWTRNALSTTTSTIKCQAITLPRAVTLSVVAVQILFQTHGTNPPLGRASAASATGTTSVARHLQTVKVLDRAPQHFLVVLPRPEGPILHHLQRTMGMMTMTPRVAARLGSPAGREVESPFKTQMAPAHAIS